MGISYLRLGIDSHKCQVVPHFLQEAVVVPLVMSRDGDGVGDLADYVELLDADLVDLIEDVDAGNVGSVPLHNVNEFVRSSITPRNKTIVYKPKIECFNHLNVMSALLILYSNKMVLTRSKSNSD